jgi:hypothetical protein
MIGAVRWEMGTTAQVRCLKIWPEIRRNRTLQKVNDGADRSLRCLDFFFLGFHSQGSQGGHRIVRYEEGDVICAEISDLLAAVDDYGSTTNGRIARVFPKLLSAPRDRSVLFVDIHELRKAFDAAVAEIRSDLQTPHFVLPKQYARESTATFITQTNLRLSLVEKPLLSSFLRIWRSQHRPPIGVQCEAKSSNRPEIFGKL